MLILEASKWESLWCLLSLVVVAAVAGGVLAFKYGPIIVLYGTSFIGSYLAMRGLTYIVGSDYPSEDDIVRKINNGQELELSHDFWFYCFVLVIFFIFSSAWQKMK